MTTSVASRNQTLVVTEVSKIQVTPVTEGDNIQLRAIRIWGSDGDNARQSLRSSSRLRRLRI
jgi:hypothetical protein